MKVTVSGHPLPEPLAFELDEERAELYRDKGQLVFSLEQAEDIVSAWATAPHEDLEHIRRVWDRRYEDFVTALYMDEEITLSWWVGSDDGYYVTDMPFDFETEVLQ